jgi:zinc transport system ATP-binding protein
MPLAVEFRDVSFAYAGGPPVLRDVELRVEQGEFVAVAGPNGGGKTTLLRLALGLERPSRGQALLYGEPATRFSRRETIGYVAQRSQLGITAPATVRELVTAGRVRRAPLVGRLRPSDRAAVEDSIARVGLGPLADRPLSRLSGGQQQRAFIAKALAGDPGLLALDEPATGVDVEAQEAFARLLARLHDELGVTVLYVAHEFGAIEPYVERILLVRGGIEFDGPPTALPRLWHDPSHAHA